MKFAMMYLTQFQGMATIKVSIILFDSQEHHSPGFLVEMDKKIYERPTWEVIRRYMLENNLFRHLPKGTEAGWRVRTYVHKNKFYHVINYAQDKSKTARGSHEY